MRKDEDKLKICLLHLDSLQKEFLDSAHRIMKAGKSNIHKLDFFALSIINRAISLNKGFKILMETENTLSAIGLLRLQLDNLIRYNAIIECEHPFELMEHILANKSIHEYKENNKTFSDNFLVKKLDDRFPNSLKLYKYLCNYIHYGYTHVDYIFREKEFPAKKPSYSVVIGDNDKFSIKDKIEYVENLVNISLNLIALMNCWAAEKDTWEAMLPKKNTFI